MPELYWRYGYLYLWLILIGIIIVVFALYVMIGVIPNPLHCTGGSERAESQRKRTSGGKGAARQPSGADSE